MLYYNDKKEIDKNVTEEQTHKHYVYVAVKKDIADEVSKNKFSTTLQKLEEEEANW